MQILHKILGCFDDEKNGGAKVLFKTGAAINRLLAEKKR